MEVNEIYNDCLIGRITPELAVEEINREIGGITASFYDPRRFTIQNHSRRISLDTRYQGKKEVNTRTQLAIFAYRMAQKNGSRFPGELHLGKHSSTKHHKTGLKRLLMAS